MSSRGVSRFWRSQGAESWDRSSKTQRVVPPTGGATGLKGWCDCVTDGADRGFGLGLGLRGSTREAVQ